MELIAQLDIERKQVYVKARIVEISESKAKNLGVKYGINAFNVNEGGLYTLASTLNGGSALAFSGLSSPTNLTQGFGLGVGLSFLSSNGVSNTLSEPSILCVNNQESSIYVGQTESILSSSATGTTTTALTQNSYTREDIGLTLKIKPRISNDNKVILTVDTTLEDVVAGSGGGLPTTTKREVKTIAVVKDGEAVIVGGLIKDKVTESESKVPLLGDIPLLGSLFKDTTYTTDKVNLVIILTPYIVEKSSDLEKLRENLQQMSKLEQEVVQKMIDDGLEKEGEVETLLSNAKTRTESVEPRKGIDFDD
jgi:general secretion pathway protein D